MCQGKPLYRTLNRTQTAAPGAVGLRQNQSNLVSRAQETRQGLLGKFRGARED
jgi:hypothetical protein